VIAAVIAPASRALADTVEACATASEEGQVLRDRGELRDARALLVKCAAETCPAVIRKDCAEWLEAVDRRMPSITPRARDDQGRDQTDVRVLADGELLADKLDGRSIAIDPGPRRLRFERAGSPAVEHSIVVREGEKARPIDVVFGAPPAAARPPAPTGGGGLHIPVASWILGGVAVVGGGGFALFAIRAKGEVDEMRTTCAPGCDPSRVDAAKREALIANIALGVGAAALVTAGVLVLVGQPKSPPAAASLHLRVGLGPTPGVVFAGAF
jgi:hypothetical protein